MISSSKRQESVASIFDKNHQNTRVTLQLFSPDIWRLDITRRFIATVSGSFESVNSLRCMLFPTGFLHPPTIEKKLTLALSSQIPHRFPEIFQANNDELN